MKLSDQLLTEKKLRDRRKTSLRIASDATGIPLTTIFRTLNGDIPCHDARQFKKLAQYFDVEEEVLRKRIEHFKNTGQVTLGRD